MHNVQIEKIARAHELLEKLSQDKVALMAYEAREAEKRDLLTFEQEAFERGREEGIKLARKLAEEKGRQKIMIEVAIAFLDVLDDETIALKFELPVEKIRELRTIYG